MNVAPVGKILIIAGAAIIILGVALLFFGRIPLAGKLPGDIIIKKKNFTVYFPVATSILFSLVLTAIFFIISFIRK
jgi:hypothetical protein